MHQFNNDDRFSLTLPGNWGEVEDGEDSVYTFAKTNDGVGALQVSLAKKILKKPQLK